MKKRIVQSGSDTWETHRGDLQTCPHCHESFTYAIWDKAAATLVLNPRCQKNGNVAVVAECPKCFEPSWVHVPMSGFGYNEKWPKAWNAAVEKLSDATKLHALRLWSKAICGQCKHLESGSVDYHAWRHCIIGSGPALTECEKFEETRT